MVVIIAWAKLFAPKAPPASQQPNKPAASAPANPGQPVPPIGGSSAPPAPNVTSAAIAANTPPAAAKSDKQERTIFVENSLYRVEFSNRGGVVKSWQLKKYKDDAKPQRVLDVVHQDASQELNAWPLSVSLSDQNLDQTANSGLYQASSGGRDAPATLTAPAELDFAWSDGHLEVTKHFKFTDAYVVQTEVTAKLDGKPINAGLSWMGGFGDTTVQNPIPV